MNFIAVVSFLRYPESEKKEQVGMADTVRVERWSEQSEQSRAEQSTKADRVEYGCIICLLFDLSSLFCCDYYDTILSSPYFILLGQRALRQIA